jgi:DNA-binding NarL/FixJ family response regulator
MRTRTIIIVSDSPRRTREIYEFVFKTESGDKIIVAHGKDEFFAATEKYRPRLVFLETSYWHELTAYEIACLSEKYPRMSIAVFCNERITPSSASGFMHLGAESFVDMRLDDESEIEEAFVAIVGEKIYMPEWVSAALEKYRLGLPDYTALQKSEIGVLRLIALGNSIDDIALKLNITNGTVRNHISNIHKKTGIHRHNELLPLALTLNAVRSDEIPKADIIRKGGLQQ